MRSLLSILLCLVLLAGCGGGLVPIGPPRTGVVTVPNADQNSVRTAIALALQARRFTIVSEQPGQFVAEYIRGNMRMQVAVTYSASNYQLAYVDSDGFRYRVNQQTGQPEISRHYPRYVERLDRTIQQELSRPAQEAQAAIEAQRQHELALQQQQFDAQQAQQNAQLEQARLEAERARADERAEELRLQPTPTFQHHSQQTVYVQGFAFDPNSVQSQSIVLQRGFMPDPITTNGMAVGQTPSAQLGLPGTCPGNWSQAPQHYLHLNSAMPFLRVTVNSQTDTTLAIVAPDGQVWCDDDSAGSFNPGLEGMFPAGDYAIYVGTYQPRVQTSYTLSLTELQNTPINSQPHVMHQQPQQPIQQGMPSCRQMVIQNGHSPAHAVHCNGAEPYCAQELLRRGHAPAHLVHCQGVEPQCAVATLQQGHAPAHLVHCR